MCTVVKNAMEICAADFECNPSTTIGCMTSEDGRRRRTAELLPGDVCVPAERDGGTWCATGLCEDLTSDGVNGPNCQIGPRSEPGVTRTHPHLDAPSVTDVGAVTCDGL